MKWLTTAIGFFVLSCIGFAVNVLLVYCGLAGIEKGVAALIPGFELTNIWSLALGVVIIFTAISNLFAKRNTEELTGEKAITFMLSIFFTKLLIVGMLAWIIWIF